MKKIVIIGGGISGLTAGIFAQKSGFESIILEKHHTVGGECTGWDRNNYHIDGCIHWLVGTKEGTPIRRLWDYVGALDAIEIHHPESFLAYEYEDVTVNFYRDLERLKSSWLKIAPVDRHSIEEFCSTIKKLQSFQMPVGKPIDMMNLFQKVRYMASMKDIGPIMQKYSKMSIQELASKFQHPALSGAINSFMPEGNYSAISILFPLGTFTGNQSSIPYGGSKAMALRMMDRYISLGGKIEKSCEAIDLSIHQKQVNEVICRNGKSFTGDYFIAACDAKVLYDRLLKGEYNDPKFQRRYNNSKDYPLASNIYVGIGYEGSMNDIPRTLRFPVSSVKINENNTPVKHLQMTHYAYEKGFAPEGHSVVTFAINQFEPELIEWEELIQDEEQYKQEKNRIGNEVLKAMETRFSHMKGKLKLLDVATPQTYQRYCNAYRGAFMGFWPTMSGKTLNHTGKIKGLKNVMLSGQWLQPPGGLPVALITGKDTIMRLCKKEKIKFREPT
jgi:phytoene dehydrogenase-like protein